MSRPNGTAVTRSHKPAFSPSRKKPRRCARQTYSSDRRISPAIISAILFSNPSPAALDRMSRQRRERRDDREDESARVYWLTRAQRGMKLAWICTAISAE
jgi:hypothetical protein